MSHGHFFQVSTAFDFHFIAEKHKVEEIQTSARRMGRRSVESRIGTGVIRRACLAASIATDPTRSLYLLKTKKFMAQVSALAAQLRDLEDLQQEESENKILSTDLISRPGFDAESESEIRFFLKKKLKFG